MTNTPSNVSQAHCHKLIAKTAKEAAGQLYELVMSDNTVRDEWKRQNPGASDRELELRFIAKNWGKCLGFARATLALMLRSPMEEALKLEVVEALALDATLMRGRGQSENPFLPNIVEKLSE